MSKEQCVALMSGGRDSLLAAARMIESGYLVTPFFCDNGHIEGSDRIIETIMTLDERYGGNVESRTVFTKTALAFHDTMNKVWNTPIKNLAENLKEVEIGQLHCLVCRSMMYTHAFAYCRVKGITHLCDGMRETESFVCNSVDFKNAITEMGKQLGIEFHTPVYGYVDKSGVKRALCDRQLPTKVLEPQCFLGYDPEKDSPTRGENTELMNFFNNVVNPVILSDIGYYEDIYKTGY